MFDEFFKNLPLTKIARDPVAAAFDSLNDKRFAQPAASSTPAPESQVAVPTPTPGPTTTAAKAPQVQADEMGEVNQDRGLIGTLAHMILGVDNNSLTPEDKAKQTQRQKNAGAMSKSAAENPGESFMDIPDSKTYADGKGLLQSLVKLFAGS